MGTSLPYTYRSDTGNFFARFVLPADIRAAYNIPHRDIRFSLKTKQREIAKHRIYEHATFFQKNIEFLRSQYYTVYPSSIFDRIKQCVANNEIINLDVSRSDTMSVPCQEPHTTEHIPDLIHTSVAPVTILSRNLSWKAAPRPIQSRYKPFSRTSDLVVEVIDPTIRTSHSWRPTTNTYSSDIFNRVTVEHGPEKITFDSGSHQQDKEDAEEWLNKRRAFGGGGGGFNDSGSESKPIKEVVELFIKHKISSDEWSDENTRKHGQSRIDFMFELIDTSKPFNTLTRADARAMRDRVKEIPDRRYKDGDKVIVAHTAKKYFILFQAICRFAYAEEYHHINIADGVEFKVSGKTNSKRQGFTQDDLTKLFNGYPYRQTPLSRTRDLYAYHFWALLIALHTGARLNEICQLRICDIIQTQGYWCFHFQEQGEGQSVKTDNSIRKVPVHNLLLNNGFLDFVKSRLAESPDHELLFIGLNYDAKNKYGKKVSDWFNGNGKMQGYLEHCALTDPEDKVFHSTRHTVIQCLVDLDVEEARIASVVGHEHGSTTSRYGRGRGIRQLGDTVNMIDHGIDLSHLNFKAFLDFARWRGRPEHGRPVDVKKRWDRKQAEKARKAREKGSTS